ncbi:hypothetical protein V6N12_002723 [Hibiscus sabdariffa]|uniref:Uncharacterized protein n=1 Tax=Hibiscus sabdariffa TaxID=183260 RepID=A0ABR2EBC5_9ROSI
MDRRNDVSSKGKDPRRVVEIKEGTTKDFGDLMADSFNGMDLSFNQKGKAIEEPDVAFSQAKKHKNLWKRSMRALWN